MIIGFVGLSHLGIVSSIATAAKGFEVIAYDPNDKLTQALQRQELPILEPDLASILTANQTHINFTSDPTKINQCQIVYFSVDIITDEQNQSDLTILNQLIDQILPHSAPNTILVILSQVSPGFTRQLESQINQTFSDKNFSLFYQVETLIFGRAVERALYPERFIIGCANPNNPLPQSYQHLLSSFNNCPLLPMRYESAELAKISINICLVASISAANTLAEVCENIGADWSEIIPALKLDKRIGQFAYLSPGLGIAGGNLERDLVSVMNLAKNYGTDGNVVEAWLNNSRYRRDWVLRTLHRTVLSFKNDAIIAIWGLAYKPNTKSVKNAPSLVLLNSLTDFQIQAYDPQVILDQLDQPKFSQVNSALAACQKADALVIMTPWSEFSQISLTEVKKVMRQPLIIDPFATLSKSTCLGLGFSYFQLGTKALEL